MRRQSRQSPREFVVCGLDVCACDQPRVVGAVPVIAQICNARATQQWRFRLYVHGGFYRVDIDASESNHAGQEIVDLSLISHPLCLWEFKLKSQHVRQDLCRGVLPQQFHGRV